MGSEIKVYGVSRLVAALLMVATAVVASMMFWPGAAGYLAYAELHGKLALFNGLEPRHRLLVGYGVTALLVVAVVLYLRMLIDNRMVLIGSEGIEVRHPLGTHRALWRDFVRIKRSWLAHGSIYLEFNPGRDQRGFKMRRRVRLPAGLLGIDLKAVVLDAMTRVAIDTIVSDRSPDMRRAQARVEQLTANHAPSRRAPVAAAGPAPRVFGKRRA